MIEHLTEGIALHCGDCLDVLAQTADNSIDSVATDPPYGIGFMGKMWDSGKSFVERKAGKATFDHVDGNHNPTCSLDLARRRKVEGQKFGAWCECWAREALRVLKPGGHLLAFGGTRTYHRLACAIEDAGFEIRDCVMWVYGSGFPKSHDVSKGIDKAVGAERDMVPPRGNIGHQRNIGNRRPWMDDPNHLTMSDDPSTDAAKQWSGWGTALKPAVEPIVMARKPLSEATIAANVMKWGTGALNIDGCRVGTENTTRHNHGGTGNPEHWRTGNGDDYTAGSQSGRWPANLIHDGSDEVLAAFPDAAGQQRYVGPGSQKTVNCYGDYGPSQPTEPRGDSGSAARFFYTAKADADDRIGSKHPTVKPIDLMRYLVRLVTPPGGLVLDPFAGTGTTGEAALREGMRVVLIEREAEYCADIRRRMALVMAGPDERERESIKANGRAKGHDDLPLFAGLT